MSETPVKTQPVSIVRVVRAPYKMRGPKLTREEMTPFLVMISRVNPRYDPRITMKVMYNPTHLVKFYYVNAERATTVLNTIARNPEFQVQLELYQDSAANIDVNFVRKPKEQEDE